MQYDIDREAAKISVLSSNKIHKYEYLTGEDILPTNKQKIIEQAKFTYSPLGKPFEKLIKTVEDQGEKQAKALDKLKSDNNNNNNNNRLTIEDVIPESVFANDEAKEEYNKIIEIEKNVDREKLFYKSNTNKYSFRKLQTIKAFGKDIYNGEITLEEADKGQSELVEKIDDFIKKMKLRNKEKRPENAEKNLYNFYEGTELVLNAFKSKIFLIKSKGSGILNINHSRLKILTPKQMLKRLPITLAQVKAGSNLENLLNEIRKIVYSLYQSKEITKKVYNNLIESL